MCGSFVVRSIGDEEDLARKTGAFVMLLLLWLAVEMALVWSLLDGVMFVCLWRFCSLLVSTAVTVADMSFGWTLQPAMLRCNVMPSE